MSRIVLVAVAWLAWISIVCAQPSGEPFLAELQTALRTGDRAVVAARIQYPITVQIAGLRVPFTDAASLLARYDDIFTRTLIDTLAQNLVIQRIGEQWRITAIAVPPPDAETTTRGTRAEGPTRVGIRGGPRPTQFSGSLLPGATDMYLLWVTKGRVLEVRLNRVQGRSALVRVVHAKTGAPFNPRIAGGARVVTGVAPESADYRIEVRRTEDGDPAPLPYMVSLSLR